MVHKDVFTQRRTMVSLMKICVQALLLQSAIATAQAAGSLAGTAVLCGSSTIGYKGTSTLECASGVGSIETCGSYSYNSDTESLTGTLQGLEWTAYDLVWVDGILISYKTQIAGAVSLCNTVALDYESVSPLGSAFMKCPTQNAIPGVSYLDNGYTLYPTGGADLRSKFETLSSVTGNTVVNDSFGVYQWFNDGTIKMYFGPQQGRTLQVQIGKLDASGLYVDEYDPSGPCVLTLTGLSQITSVDKLRQSGDNYLGGGGGDGVDDGGGRYGGSSDGNVMMFLEGRGSSLVWGLILFMFSFHFIL